MRRTRHDSGLRYVRRGRRFPGSFQRSGGSSPARKVDYPLEEILILCLLAVLAGADAVTDIALFGRKKLSLLRLPTVRRARRRTITSATFWPSWTPSNFSAASSPGLRRLPAPRRTSSPSMGRPCGGPVRRRRAARPRSTWSLPSRHASAWCFGQVKVAEKSNEIVAIPKLLEMLAIEGRSSPSMPWAASVDRAESGGERKPTTCSR